MRPVSVSVDLGTSHTVAVVGAEDGRATPLLFDGSPLLGSAVFKGTAGDLTVGRDATHSARLYPERLEPHPKRRIDDGTVLLGDAEVTVRDMFAAILGRVRDECVRVTGSVPPLTLTHPATWGPVRRQTLIDAAESAGMASPRLLPEPVAAARYFSRRQAAGVPVGSVIAVYDLGGGTFDISVVRRTDTGFDVLAADGASDLGGVDVDHALTDHLGRPHREDPQWWKLMDPQRPDERRQRRHFLDDVRAAKERLSRENHVDLLIPLVEKESHLTRGELETLARPLLDRTVRLTRTLIRAVGREPGDLAGLFLVGGASRMPLVATLLHRATGIAPTAIDQPETVVAYGGLTTVPSHDGGGDFAAPGRTGAPPPPPDGADPAPPPSMPTEDRPEAATASPGDPSDEAEPETPHGGQSIDPETVCELGRLAEERGDPVEAEAWYRRGADASNGTAMRSLARLLLARGDLAEAEPWLRRAADLGDLLAMAGLAVLPMMREAGSEDLDMPTVQAFATEAAPWVRRLTAEGPPDDDAVHGFLGAFLGDRIAADIPVVFGNLLMVSGDVRQAEFWLCRAADAGDHGAATVLAGVLMMCGDLTDAEKWFRRLAEAGDADAMGGLGEVLRKRGASAEAERWFERGAEAGGAGAMAGLGEMLAERGASVEAERWFRRGVEEGDAEAMAGLGALLVERGSFIEAERWYRRAVDAGATTWDDLPGWCRSADGPAGEWYRESRSEYAKVLTSLADLLARRGDSDEAETWRRKATDLRSGRP
ncbi:Hsp70 family protein [Stackebrandtia albiflava]|nr:Hsp70 family protein [Stackebrandtia albiflava]